MSMSNDVPDCDWPEELTEEAWMLDQEEKLKALSEAIAKVAAETKEIEVLPPSPAAPNTRSNSHHRPASCYKNGFPVAEEELSTHVH